MQSAAKALPVPKSLLGFLPFLLSLSAHAAAPVAPGAGTILQQIQPVTPPAPSSTGTGLRIEQEGGAKLPTSAPFEVKTIQISGNALFDTAILHALVADGEGESLTLTQLDELAARITEYYQKHGYPLARAYIPAQIIQSGVVRMEIIEARYGTIRLDNHSRVNDPLLQDTLALLQSGQAIGQAGLDRTLLLLSDIPGVVVSATLKPGEAVGTSDLLVEAAPAPAVTGNVALDDYGNRYTGRPRAGGTVNFIDPLKHGDILSASVLSSGSEMDYGSVSYNTLLNGQGSRMGGSYSLLHYALGDTLASLDAHGTAQVESLWAKQRILRGRDINLYGQIEYDSKQLQDHIDASGLQTDRHLANWTVILAGDSRDTLLSSVANTCNVTWTSGRVGFDNAAAQLADAATAKTQGRFSKWNAYFTRLQNLSQRSGVYLAFSGQWANANLDSSEKMIAGGPYTVRAYDMGAISGDTGYLGTVEFRYDLVAQWQAVAFIDSAHVTVNKNTWVAGTNSATLSGAGVGINWMGSKQWSAKAYIATPIGSIPTLLGKTNSARAWVEIDKGF